jgi:hypothetical protein
MLHTYKFSAQVLSTLAWISSLWSDKPQMSQEYRVDWDADVAEQLGFSHLKPPAAVAFEDLTNFHIYLDLDNPLPYDRLDYILLFPDSCVQLVSKFEGLASQDILDIFHKCSVLQPSLVSLHHNCTHSAHIFSSQTIRFTPTSRKGGKLFYKGKQFLIERGICGEQKGCLKTFYRSIAHEADAEFTYLNHPVQPMCPMIGKGLVIHVGESISLSLFLAF